MVTRPRHFCRSDSGVTLVEGLIVFPLMLTVIITFIEFGFAMFQWEQTGRAVAVGARLAAVSNPLVTNFSDLGADYVNVPAQVTGDPLPDTMLRVSCTGANATARLPLCNGGIDRILRGSDGVCNAVVGTSVPGMCDLNARIQPENVVVTYTRDGLGYVGRDQGPITTVTVQLRNLSFQTFFLGPLFGLTDLPIRPSPVTFTSEDLATCANPERTATSFSTPCP